MDEDKIIGTRFGGIGAPSSPDDVYIGVTRDGHDVYQRRDGTRYTVYEPGTKTIYTAKYNPNNTDWYNTGNIAVDENGRRFYGNTPEEAQQKYEAWKQQKLQEQGAWSTIDMINAMTGGIFNQLSPTQLGRNVYNIATGNPDYARQFVYGNNGVIPDEWAAEHPALAAVINAGADIGVLGGPSLWRATGRLAANTGRGVATAVKNAPRVVRSIPENMISVADKGKQAAEYLKDLYNYNRHVHRINTRGNLYSGIPMPDLVITDDTIKAAIENIKRAYKANKPINPYDVRIVTKNLSNDALFKMNDEVLLNALASQEGSPKLKLLNRLFDGVDMDMAEIESIVGDKELIAGLPEEARTNLLNGYDDLLMTDVRNAENQVEAARAARGKVRGSRYQQELNDMINSAEKPEVPPIEESATQAAAAPEGSSSTIRFDTDVTPQQPITLAERYIENHPEVFRRYNIKGKKSVGSWEQPTYVSENKVGIGGDTYVVSDSAGKPVLNTTIDYGSISPQNRENLFNSYWWDAADNGVNSNLRGLRKYVYKPVDNYTNLRVRQLGNEIDVFGPGVKLKPWAKKTVWGLGLTGAGAGAVGAYRLVKPLFSEAPMERYVDFGKGRIVPISQVPFFNDSLNVFDEKTGRLVPVFPVGNNYVVGTVGAAEEADALEKMKEAQSNSNAPVDYNEEPDDSANVNSVINGH